jgi:AraC-like DNA-binding protein
MLYVEPDRLADADLAADLEIARPVARDRLVAGALEAAFARLAAPGASALAREEAVLILLRRAFGRIGSAAPAPPEPSPAVRLARQRLDDAPERPATLAELAGLSGVSRFQLLRGFAREVGTTPHAYLLQARIRLAQRLLARGETPAGAALAAGFADQSHLTRAFLRQVGTTPGRYRAALCG